MKMHRALIVPLGEVFENVLEKHKSRGILTFFSPFVNGEKIAERARPVRGSGAVGGNTSNEITHPVYHRM